MAAIVHTAGSLYEKMTITTISQNICFGGTQGVYSHTSTQTGGTMRFGVFMPPQPSSGAAAVPVLYWLSGLTCTEENFIVKAGAQRIAAELGVAIVTADTSPRGLDLAGVADSYDFGSGAGFYVDATQAPWSKNFRMYSYVSQELPWLVNANFLVDPGRVGIFGHSMGGHGALVLALRNPEVYKSVSAFAPISSPMRCPWGEKALTGYLGPECDAWQDYDACALIEARGWKGPPILVEQGTKDQFLETQLKPELLQQACQRADVTLDLRMREGYDHSYFFIASFVESHLKFHARNLSR
jgi:S-formylglutathione hydrolase